MAADRPLAERGLVEIKMGRSKFPGKPSKIGNRRRVNLSSCALPDENDSSKAAKNIYLGLSVFNETFGDNEMVAPGPFHGFSMSEVEEALAEARLQQKEAEEEHRKQGIDINLWDTFQSELFSITSCSTSSNSAKDADVNSSMLSFDGGGSCRNAATKANSFDNSDKRPSKLFSNRNVLARKTKEIFFTPKKKIKKAIKFQSPRVKLKKLHCSPVSKKSLQSQAAKKLLEKAKLSNSLDSSKNAFTEKKFVLSSHNICSPRIHKSKKKFGSENLESRKFLRSSAGLLNKPMEANLLDKTSPTMHKDIYIKGCENDNDVKKCLKKGGKFEVKSRTVKKFNSSKHSSLNSNVGKIILREPRLQLDNSNISILEGPFSTPNASSLSPNSQLKVNPMQSMITPGNKICGVCEVVRFYKVVEIPKKFGIYCCEFCQKFISKVIKTLEPKTDLKLQCLRSNGLCAMTPVIKCPNLNIHKPTEDSRCHACWLQLCLKKFKMPLKLKRKLLDLLPVNMQMNINLEFHSIGNCSTQKFKLSNNIDDFRWLNENRNLETQMHTKEMIGKKSTCQNNLTSQSHSKSLRKRTKTRRNENEVTFSPHGSKIKPDCDEKMRQQIALKGPRVKHVCRSASVALGQPLATFSNDASPIKKPTNESTENCNNCDDDITTNSNEAQGVGSKPLVNGSALENKQEHTDKKMGNSKEVFSVKTDKTAVQTQAVTKSKKRTNAKVEHPISMDFWECYDPEEISETGFGLIGSETFTVRALCFLCGSSGHEKLIHCASCCEPYHEFCVDEIQFKSQDDGWKFDWVCPSCTVCITCGKKSGQQLKCVKCENSYHTECVDRVGGRLLHSPDRPWVCSACLRCKSCNGVDVSVFVGNLPLCKACFVLRQKGNYCPLCQRCYEDDDYDSKMMECGQCKCWVHAKCEGLSDEKYQVLSFLPESVEYVCRMCCVMPPAPWWLAVEAELKSGYLGVLKALSKNRKACTMLKWSPRKQCTCRPIEPVLRTLNFEDSKSSKVAISDIPSETEKLILQTKENQNAINELERERQNEPALISERKTSIEVISHPTESLKLTLKIMKGVDSDGKAKVEPHSEVGKDGIHVNGIKEKHNNNDNKVRVKKCLSNEESSEDSLTNTFDCQEDSQASLNFLFKGNTFSFPPVEHPRSLSSPMNPPSDSGIGSTDDELKTNCLTDEESCKLDEHQTDSNSRAIEPKSNCDPTGSFLEEKQECYCFLDVDSYNSRSKPFSPNLMSIKKKVTTSEYSSLHQFHQDMERMIETTHSAGLMDLYHQTIKEIFPWFDPKFSKVQNSSQKVTGSVSLESTPVKNTPVKNTFHNECKILKDSLNGKPLDYFYSDYVIEDTRVCLLCKAVGDGFPGDTGRLLYCGQNEWVHCNCALWSGEVFEEIDGSLQNVHSAISRGRSIRCPECNLKGASIGCCARNCQETYHFKCARKIGCIFMDDKTMYCPLHMKESLGKLVQNEKEFEIRRPVYVELDKRKMKSVDSNQIRFAVGALQVNSLGKFVADLSDQEEAIIPEQMACTRLFWSCYEPWRVVRYHFTVRIMETENSEGIDFGINFTIDHSKEPEEVELKLKQLRHFQEHNTLLDLSDSLTNGTEDKIFYGETKILEANAENRLEGKGALVPSSFKIKKDHKVIKRILDQFETKEEENCLSDNQNTADLLPPDLEEAIFKDLPNDILDGISMQDIFMDIKNDPYENTSKDGTNDDSSETEYNLETLMSRAKRLESNVDINNQTEFWNDGNDCRQDMVEGSFLISKSVKDAKKTKMDSKRETVLLKTYQKSCNLNWSCKGENITNKRKKTSSKCHVTVNFLEPQERGNMLQELKFTDGLVSISTGPLSSMKDLKSRLDDGKRSIQEEGKENKCLSWQSRLQPRLLQVDGGVDSSSSGSEAGESPQRIIDEGPNSKLIAPKESLSFYDSSLYSSNLLKCLDGRKIVSSSDYNHSDSTKVPQLDGIEEYNSEVSEAEDEHLAWHKLRKRRKREYCNMNKNNIASLFEYKINQCDGGVDSECEDENLVSCASSEELAVLNQTSEEPVKCSNCHCTYRTKISYQRHLDSCNSNFILSSSEGEISDEESPKKPKSEVGESPIIKNESDNLATKKVDRIPPSYNITSSSSPKLSIAKTPESTEKLEVKKEKTVKRTYARKKANPIAKNAPLVNSTQPVQQILVQQPNSTPTLILQDLAAPNVIPTAYIDSAPTVGFVTAVDSQNPFGKTQLITATAPNGLISGNYQFPGNQGNQILGGLCLNSANMQTSMPAFIIQQPPTPGTLLSPQSTPVMMASEQMMLGSTGLIQDPNTGGMFLTSYNQPIFYNMETVVRNTVMQTNQFVSNVLATTYSQTSTQIFRTSEMEQMVSVPNYIVVGPNPPTDELICVPTPQTFIPNPTPIQVPNQNFFTPSPVSALQAFNAEAKIVSAQINPVQNVQSVCSPVVLGKMNTPNLNVINQPVNQILQTRFPSSVRAQTMPQTKASPVIVKKNQMPNPLKNGVILKPSITKLETKAGDATLPSIKSKPIEPKSRALVDYINNFKSDLCDSLSPNNLEMKGGLETKRVELPLASNVVASIAEPMVKAENLKTNVPLLSPNKNGVMKPSKCYFPNVKKKKMKISKPSLVTEIEPLGTTENMSTSLEPPIPSTVEPMPTKLNEASTDVPPSEEVPNPKEVNINLPDMLASKVHSEIRNDVQETVESVICTNKTPQTKAMEETGAINTDSPAFEDEVKQCLSMPLLDDRPATPNIEDEKLKNTNEVSFNNKILPCEVLPLQENVHNGLKNISSQKFVLTESKQSQVFDQKVKSKKRTYSNDQNLNADIPTAKESKSSDLAAHEKPIAEIRKSVLSKMNEVKGPKLIFDVISDDGFKSSSTSMAELWANICDSVQEMRASLKIPPMPVARKGYQVLGMQNHGLQHCLEQLRGVEQCVKYKCKYFIREPVKEDGEEETKGNPSGCARTEKFTTRKEYDMFAWLASKHRQLPKLTETAEEALSSIRRANNLPMAMRYRNLKETAKLYVGVYRSKIHGRGLFCLREIEAGEMVIEYAGEVIRSNLTDKREKYYTDRGIGCYMFRIDDHFVVDATMKGNAARFINHSCEPNCYSRVVDILGKKHIVIFALRRINLMEELTYDYKFPFEDEKISCHCLSKKCKKYLN